MLLNFKAFATPELSVLLQPRLILTLRYNSRKSL